MHSLNSNFAAHKNKKTSMFRNIPTVTKNLLIINIVAFLAAQVLSMSGIDLNDIFGLHFFMASDFRIYQLVTYMFMHGNFTHIFFNMFALWMFGCVVENVWGPKKYLFYYMVCGIGAGLMQEIAQFILNNFNKSTFDGEFNALFAIQSVPMLLKYYKIFKSLNPKIKIGAVFTYAANESQDDEKTGMNQGFADDKVTSDELQAIMDDYNEMFNTAFTTENFSAYYDDINLRMKKKKPDMEPLDLLLVVGMFLTGFDAKKLNTLYVDKNLEYHGLLQAFSRTNRVLNEKKRFGKVVCFRDLKENVDAAIKLFSNNQPNEFIIREPFEEVKKELNNLTIEFLKKYPKPQYIDTLQSELDKR